MAAGRSADVMSMKRKYDGSTCSMMTQPLDIRPPMSGDSCMGIGGMRSSSGNSTQPYTQPEHHTSSSHATTMDSQNSIGLSSSYTRNCEEVMVTSRHAQTQENFRLINKQLLEMSHAMTAQRKHFDESCSSLEELIHESHDRLEALILKVASDSDAQRQMRSSAMSNMAFSIDKVLHYTQDISQRVVTSRDELSLGDDDDDADDEDDDESEEEPAVCVEDYLKCRVNRTSTAIGGDDQSSSSSSSSHQQLVYYTAAAKVLLPLDQQQQQRQRPAVDPACLAPPSPSPSHPACPSFDSTFRVLMTSIIGPSTSSYSHSIVPAPIVRNHLASSITTTTTAVDQRRP